MEWFQPVSVFTVVVGVGCIGCFMWVLKMKPKTYPLKHLGISNTDLLEQRLKQPPFELAQNILHKSLKPTNNNAEEEEEEVGELLVVVLGEQAQQLARQLIKVEIQSSVGDALFRSNNSCTKYLSAFAIHHGLNYAQQTLGPCLIRIVSEEGEMEVNVDRLSDPDQLEPNRSRATTAFQWIVDSITCSASKVPPPLVELCKYIYEESSTKYPLHMSRHYRFGIIKDNRQLSSRSQKGLTMMARMILKLASDSQFQQKEKHMMCFNPLLEDNKPKIYSFLEPLIREQQKQDTPPWTTSSSSSFSKSLKQLEKKMTLLFPDTKTE